MRGKNYHARKAFLTSCHIEQGVEYLQLVQSKVVGLRFALDYYGIEDKYQSHGQIAERYGVQKPFVSQEIMVVLAFLGMEEEWSCTTLDRLRILRNKLFPSSEMSSRKRKLLAKKADSERLRIQMGWTDIPLDLKEEEKQIALQLLQLYESRKLEQVKCLRHGDEVYIVLVLRYGLDAAGCYRSCKEVGAAMNLSNSAVHSRLSKGLRYVKNKLLSHESA